MKTHAVLFGFSFCATLFFPLMNALVYVISGAQNSHGLPIFWIGCIVQQQFFEILFIEIVSALAPPIRIELGAPVYLRIV